MKPFISENLRIFLIVLIALSTVFIFGCSETEINRQYLTDYKTGDQTETVSENAVAEGVSVEEQEEVTAPEPLEVEEMEPSVSEEDITKDNGAEAQEGEKINDVRTADLVIGVIADAHSDPSNGLREIAGFSKVMQTVKPDFVIELGDLIENREDYKTIDREDGIRDYRKASATVSYSPLYHVIGNHEILNLSKKDCENLMGHNNYYSFIINGYQIIVLDSNYESDGDDVDPDNDKEGSYGGAIPEREREWLRGKLRGHEKNIIFVHHPLYNLANADEIEDILDKYGSNVVMIANGHKHRADKRKVEGTDTYDMPSIRHQNGYAIVEVNGMEAEVEFRELY